MAVPFTIGKLIDFFSSTNPQLPLDLSLWQASSLLLLLFTTGAMANAGTALLMRMAGQRMIARLRERTYAAALEQEVEYVEDVRRLSVDTSIVGESVTRDLSDGLRAVVMSSVGCECTKLALMFYVSPTLTMLMLVLVPSMSLGAVLYGRYLKKLSNRTQEAVGEMTKVASESLSALRTVQAYNAQNQESSKFHQRVKDVLALAKKEATASAIFFGSTEWSGNVTILCLLGYGGILVSKGQISVGDLTSLIFYTAYVGNGLTVDAGARVFCGLSERPLNHVSLLQLFLCASIMRGVGAGTRIFQLLDRTPAIPPHNGVLVASQRRGILKFENIKFEYPSRKGVDILKDFNVEVAVGESVAIVQVLSLWFTAVADSYTLNASRGHSGGGKSSIHSLLLRYYDPTSGNFPSHRGATSLGLCPKTPSFTGTIAYGNPEATREQIEQAAREANCEFVWGMPQGFDTPIGRLSLSGGQRQRLAIARALLKKPVLLALDEATSSLDATSEHRVNDAIDKILWNQHATAERIAVLEDGRIVESGTYHQLLSRQDSRFRVLMAAQLAATAGEKVASNLAPQAVGFANSENPYP
ncbi:P-loop containing nucleoside triphosphate hydrolase protein [Mycena sanguinolenta]|nr:P-loop containing nucleoside triphosphate hydrolase protein [Mycena sanguinolenta]